MLKHTTSTLLGILCVLSFLSVPAEAIYNIKGVQPSNLANILQSGSGYQGTFFIKSPALIEISNNMLKRAGVQYTLTQENTRGSLGTYVKTESAPEETNAPQQTHTSEPTSFSHINHQVQSHQTEESANNSSLQKTGVLFSSVSDLLQ